MKYQEWLREWLEHYMKSTVKSKTYQRYSEIAEQHLIPKLGDIEINELTPMTVQKYITELLQCGNLKTGEGLSASSVNAIIAVIQKSLKTAHLLCMTERYEMDKIQRPKLREKQIQCFSSAEQKRIELAVINDRRNKMKGILICLYTGLRIGELLALEWGDIDLVKGEMTVSKTCHDGKNENGRYIRYTDTPKTVSSVRVIPLSKTVLQILKEIKKNRISRFVISSGNTVPSVRSYQRSFELLLVKLNLPHRGFHSLRHTFATRALECGMDVRTLSEILGHKNPTVTLNRYAHSMMEHKREMMDLVGKLF